MKCLKDLDDFKGLDDFQVNERGLTIESYLTKYEIVPHHCSFYSMMLVLFLSCPLLPHLFSEVSESLNYLFLICRAKACFLWIVSTRRRDRC